MHRFSPPVKSDCQQTQLAQLVSADRLPARSRKPVKSAQPEPADLYPLAGFDYAVATFNPALRLKGISPVTPPVQSDPERAVSKPLRGPARPSACAFALGARQDGMPSSCVLSRRVPQERTDRNLRMFRARPSCFTWGRIDRRYQTGMFLNERPLKRPYGIHQ